MTNLSNNKINIAIIGGGRFFNTMHAPVLSNLRGINRIAIANPEANIAAELKTRWNFQAAYTDVQEMLEKENPACVYVFTPPAWTPRYAVQLITAGIPSFLEKPIANTAAELQDINKAYQQFKTPHFVAFNRRFSPILTKAREFIDNSDTISQINVNFFRHDTKAPNAYLSSAIHAIDAMRFLCGDLKAISTFSSEMEYFDHNPIAFNSILTFESGISGSLNYNCRCGHVSELYQIFAENQSLIAELSIPGDINFEKSLKIVEDKGKKTIRSLNLANDLPEEQHYPAFFNGIQQEHEQFLNLLINKQPMANNITDSIKTMKAAFAIRSGYSGPLSEFVIPE